jgi:hypothetical protein
MTIKDNLPYTENLNVHNTLQIGDIVGDTRRMVIACTKKNDYTPGDSFAYWIAICAKEDHLHPYVVWDVIARPEGWVCQSGDYAYTLKQALDYYHERGGQNAK